MARAIEDYGRKKAGTGAQGALGTSGAQAAVGLLAAENWSWVGLVSRGSGNRLRRQSGLEHRRSPEVRLWQGHDDEDRRDRHASRSRTWSGSKASFLPPKEILSIFDAIVATRETVEIAAFDDTYYDLVQDYRQPPTSGNLQANIKKALLHLENVTGSGEVEMEKDGNIVFRRGKEVFNMHQTAEGIKKIGILSRLMRNRRLTPAGGCMLFVDEPEVNLHPKAIVLFAEMLHEFAQSGIQVYLTTHSYFLLKRLEQLAREKNTDYSLLDLRKQDGAGVTGTVSKLADGLPQNPIVEESLRLFDRDVQLDLAD
jgi:predicted ATPase